ncbi:uncharacterized protein BXZ73DRAFT_104519 [Epithele typhae]|uniref:uncharacterized protein n=1 Tax=Epithele typhae TaxID=378194 RepID=UPI002007DE34|nr:uncharacterized protein BXZ73DRAFT_104519 [Epithele typhae]KAH9921230.1 hypothetical protein BXZ73DRAFT_104519 [Epithele typhae]
MPPSSVVRRLNEDIVLNIVSYLPGYDAVQLALTCKFMYAICSPRFPIEISNQAQLVGRHHDLCHPHARSAGYIHHLKINLVPYIYKEYLDTIGNILTATKNLRSLEFQVCDASFILHPPATRALAQMQELRSLSCSPVSPGVLSVIKSIPSRNLVTLDLCYYSQRHHDFSPLLSTLEAFPKLSTLALKNFLPGPALLDITRRPSFPSILHVTLRKCSATSTDLVYLCPKLESLNLSLDREEHSAGAHTDSRRRWPKLSRLTAHIGRAAAWGADAAAQDDDDRRTILVGLLEHRAGPVPHLELTGEWEFTRDGVTAVDAATSRRLTRLLAALQPRVLTLPVHAGFQSLDKRLDGRMWTEVARALPRLRALTLRCSEHHSWVPPDTLAAALAHLPLRCLFIDTSPVDDPKASGPDYRVVERIQVLGALPAKLLAALTKMRVLGIKGMTAPPEDAFKDLKLEVFLPYELDEWRKEHGERNTRWWRVDGTGAERRLVELWREDGEHAQKLVETAEKYRVADLAEIYLDKCRYEP